MALNRRQAALFEHTVDIYKPNAISVGANLRMTDVSYPSTPTYSGVKCYLFSKPDTAAPTVMGRSTEDMIFTLDVFHFEAAVDVDDTYCLKFTTAGHPLEGLFWIVRGGPQIRTSTARRRPNQLKVFASQTTRPPGIAGSGFLGVNGNHYIFSKNATPQAAQLDVIWDLGFRGLRDLYRPVPGGDSEEDVDHANELYTNIRNRGGRVMIPLVHDQPGMDAAVTGGQLANIQAYCAGDLGLARIFIAHAGICQNGILPQHAAKTIALAQADATMQEYGEDCYYQPFDGPEGEPQYQLGAFFWDFTVTGNRAIANANGFNLAPANAITPRYTAMIASLTALAPDEDKIVARDAAHRYKFADGNTRTLGNPESGTTEFNVSDGSCEPEEMADALDEQFEDLIADGCKEFWWHGLDGRYKDVTYDSDYDETPVLFDAQTWDDFRHSKAGIAGGSREDTLEFVHYPFRLDMTGIQDQFRRMGRRVAAL